MKGIFIPANRPFSKLSESDLIDIINRNDRVSSSRSHLHKEWARQELKLRKDIIEFYSKK